MTNQNSLIDKIEGHKKEILEQMINPETLEVKPDVQKRLVDHFRKRSPIVQKNHSEFMDRAFEMIINHIYPVARYSHWKDLKGDYERDFEVLKKYQTLTKYQKEDFIKEHKLNKVDMLAFSMNPNRVQFKFLKNVFLKTEYRLKMKIREGIKSLLAAKNTFDIANAELFAMNSLFLKGGMLKDEQFIKSSAKEILCKSEDSFRNIWDVQVEKREYYKDLSKDKTYGKYAKRLLQENDYIVSLPMSHFSLPDENVE